MPCLVTTSWDDGWKEDLNTVKLLERYGLKGTFYITVGDLNKERFLSETDVRDLSRQGYEIGAHTVTHPKLPLIPIQTAKLEIERSKSMLERLIEAEVVSFSYPKGLYSEAIKKLVAQAGFKIARTTKPFCVDRPRDPFEVGVSISIEAYRILLGTSFMRKFLFRYNPLEVILGARDWEKRAQTMFDIASRNGGIWHLFGHAYQIKNAKIRAKLEKILSYVANRRDVVYGCNRQISKFLANRK
jgi:peptidoglycan/xylan/chitin deacetylase (PgdA/CDA1 family)